MANKKNATNTKIALSLAAVWLSYTIAKNEKERADKIRNAEIEAVKVDLELPEINYYIASSDVYKGVNRFSRIKISITNNSINTANNVHIINPIFNLTNNINSIPIIINKDNNLIHKIDVEAIHFNNTHGAWEIIKLNKRTPELKTINYLSGN